MRRILLLGCVGYVCPALVAQTAYAPQESEYSVTRGLLGDQVKAQVSLKASGGYVVWQDNAIDGSGLGIGARELNSYFSPITVKTFRVNETTAGDQENPVVQLLPGGGAMVAWQGGPQGSQDIFVRAIGPAGTFAGGEILVNTHTANQQGDPALTVLGDGTVVAVWSSHDQDGSLQGLYAQRLSATGAKLGGEFPVTQVTLYNQRTASVAALDTGGFVVAWVSEQERFQNSVDIKARRFDSKGVALGGEFRVNATTNVCANPAAIGAEDGRFLVAWSQRDIGNLSNAWAVWARPYSATGTALAAERLLNAAQPGNRFAPKLARNGNEVMAVWTSGWQDGSWEGVYGRFLKDDGTPKGDEFRVNTTTISRQYQPAVAGDGDRRFGVFWSSFVGVAPGIELFGQRYASDQALSQPAPPLVSALDSFSLMAAWPELSGYQAPVTYKVYVNDAITPLSTTANYLVITDLAPASTHNVRLAYELSDGRLSPKSDSAAATTWGRDRNYDGLPDDWQTLYWGADSKQWPAASADSDRDGASNLEEFLAGTHPLEATSVLRTRIVPVTGGLLIEWNAAPGSLYQLQASADLAAWSDLEGPRFAAGNVASTLIPATSAASYYRVIRIR